MEIVDLLNLGHDFLPLLKSGFYNLNINRKVWNTYNFYNPKGGEENELISQENFRAENFRYVTSKSLLFIKLNPPCLS